MPTPAAIAAIPDPAPWRGGELFDDYLARKAAIADRRAAFDAGTPVRIRLSRARGWRKPSNTIVVARPTRWGNPIRIVPVRPRGPFDLERDGVGFIAQCTDLSGARAIAVRRHRELIDLDTGLAPTVAEIRHHLTGRHLACWCPYDHPCHADTLLELANTNDRRSPQ